MRFNHVFITLEKTGESWSEKWKIVVCPGVLKGSSKLGFVRAEGGKHQLEELSLQYRKHSSNAKL